MEQGKQLAVAAASGGDLALDEGFEAEPATGED